MVESRGRLVPLNKGQIVIELATRYQSGINADEMLVRFSEGSLSSQGSVETKYLTSV